MSPTRPRARGPTASDVDQTASLHRESAGSRSERAGACRQKPQCRAQRPATFATAPRRPRLNLAGMRGSSRLGSSPRPLIRNLPCRGAVHDHLPLRAFRHRQSYYTGDASLVNMVRR
jgi:hypothetical protein